MDEHPPTPALGDTPKAGGARTDGSGRETEAGGREIVTETPSAIMESGITEREGYPPSHPVTETGPGHLDASSNRTIEVEEGLSVITDPQSPENNELARMDATPPTKDDPRLSEGWVADDDGAIIPDVDGPDHHSPVPEHYRKPVNPAADDFDRAADFEDDGSPPPGHAAPGDTLVSWYVDHRAVKFDRRAQERFLRAMMVCPTVNKACSVAGVSRMTVYWHKRNNPDFSRAMDESREFFKDLIEEEIFRRAVEGWDEPVFGGQFKDMVVGYVRRHDGKLLELLAKRHIPEYRDKATVDHNHGGGVLLIPTAPATVEDWHAQASKYRIPTSPPGEVIDVTPTEKR